jgi:hypothetical protein
LLILANASEVLGSCPMQTPFDLPPASSRIFSAASAFWFTGLVHREGGWDLGGRDKSLVCGNSAAVRYNVLPDLPASPGAWHRVRT